MEAFVLKDMLNTPYTYESMVAEQSMGDKSYSNAVSFLGYPVEKTRLIAGQSGEAKVSMTQIYCNADVASVVIEGDRLMHVGTQVKSAILRVDKYYSKLNTLEYGVIYA